MMGEWKEYRYTDLATIIGGGTPKTSVSDYWNGEIPWLSVKDFLPVTKYVYDTEKHISELGLLNSSTKLLEKNDIVISARGTIGAMAMIPYPMCFNQSCFGLRGNNVVDKNFLYYLTRTKVNELRKSAHGSVFDTITRETFDNLRCLVPPLQTQQKIGNILSSLDSKIELNKRINDNLEQQAQALFKSWFVDFEPFKDRKFVDSELGMIPEGWRVCSAETIFKINIGKTPPRKEQQWFTNINHGNVKWVSISDLGSNEIFIEDSKEYLTKEAIAKFNIIVVPEDTILVSFKLTVGRVGISNCELTTNEAVARFYLPESYFREYTYLSLKNYNYARLGSTSSIATAVNSKIIKNMKLLIPPVTIISEFSKRINPLFNAIRIYENEIRNLSKIRNTLLPELISGELKINDINN